MAPTTFDDDDDAVFPTWLKWTVGGLGLLIAATIGIKGFRWLVNHVGAWLEFSAPKQFALGVEEQLRGHNILILGTKSTGKTALLWFLENGRPTRADGSGPDGTIGAVVVGKDFTINKDKWAKVPKDVSGEAPERLWKMVIEEIQPTGIIYMVNPSTAGTPLHVHAIDGLVTTEVNQMFRWAFDVYRNAKLPLNVFHVFLNFADLWATPELTFELPQLFKKAIVKRIITEPAFASTRIDVAVTQLAPDRSKWSEAKNAVDRFGADLGN